MKLEFDDVVKQINIEKAKGKHSLQLKVLQYETFKDKRPKMLYQQLGYKNVGDKLAANGYNIDYTSTSRQATQKIIGKTSIISVRDLHTTNMVIKW